MAKQIALNTEVTAVWPVDGLEYDGILTKVHRNGESTVRWHACGTESRVTTLRAKVLTPAERAERKALIQAACDLPPKRMPRKAATPRPTIVITDRPDGIHGALVWEGIEVDRRSTYGWCMRNIHRPLLERLKRAVEAGVIFTNPRVMRDDLGKTFVREDGFISGRHMNADLRALGY